METNLSANYNENISDEKKKLYALGIVPTFFILKVEKQK